MITINNNLVSATSPEGQTKEMKLDKFAKLLAPPALSTDGVILPDGVKAIIPGNQLTIVVHQTPPRMWCLKWIASDSPQKYGAGTKYRKVTIALPYVIVMALFSKERLTANSEAFFTTKPLTSLDNELLAPALLNCSKWPPSEYESRNRMTSWICVQNLPFGKVAAKDRNSQIHLGLKELLRCLFETGFNLSSESHEGSSWFTESAKVDKRIETIEAWEKASAKDPLFVLDVPWIPVKKSVSEMAARMFKIQGDAPKEATQASLERMVFSAR